MTIVYHGLGYVGLTGAYHFAKAGVPVIGYDPDPEVVAAVNERRPKAGEFLSYLGGSELPSAVLRATTDFAEVSHGMIQVIAVPTEKNDRPWMDLVKEVVRTLCTRVQHSMLIVIESTLTPGTIDELVAEIPALREAPGVRGRVLLAHAPRRDWFADPKKNLATLFRVVGGINDDSTEAAVSLLEDVTPPELILKTDARTAELVKPLENALFHLPIMLGHELALCLPEHDVAKALALAVTHWRFESFGGLYVGLGSGGRCVPMGGRYLSEAINIANEAPDVWDNPARRSMPTMMLDSAQSLEHEITYRAAKTFRDCKRVVVLGAAYRPGFADLGGSPGLRIASAIRYANINPGNTIYVQVHDPVVPDTTLRNAWDGDVVRSEVLLQALELADGVVVATPHESYRDLPEQLALGHGTRILDAHGLWAHRAALFESCDIDYRQVGRPGWLR